jgi:hypothetical protein
MEQSKSMFYKLYRESGFLFFNSFKNEECFWCSTQYGSHGGGSIYVQISSAEFELVFEGKLDVETFRDKFSQQWSTKLANEIESEFNIKTAIEAHQLGQYLQKNHDGKYVPNNKPIKSIVPANKQRQASPPGGTH